MLLKIGDRCSQIKHSLLKDKIARNEEDRLRKKRDELACGEKTPMLLWLQLTTFAFGETEKMTAEELYKTGLRQLETNHHTKALESFAQLLMNNHKLYRRDLFH